MSYTRLDVEAPIYRSNSVVLPSLGRFARVAAWSVVNIGLMFAEQLAEILAPLLLLAGGIWWIIPKVLDGMKLDGQANDVLQMVKVRLPLDIYYHGHYFSADVLINWGLWAIATVAICRTLSTALGALLLDRP